MYAKRGESGYSRIPGDEYFTPRWCTEVLADTVTLPKSLWEPAVGTGAIAKVLKARGHYVFGSDIKDHGYPDTKVVDFLSLYPTLTIGHRAIVTNPPYDLAQEFVEHAMLQTQMMDGMVCMLLRNEFDSASSRLHLFTDSAFVGKIVLTQRPNWTDSRKASPRHNFAWFIWDWANKSAPTLRYQTKLYKTEERE